MEEIKNSNLRFNENQKIKLYQFITTTESKLSDSVHIELLDKWKQIVQNAQQKNQLRDLFNHKILPSLDSIEFLDKQIEKRFLHLKKITLELCE